MSSALKRSFKTSFHNHLVGMLGEAYSKLEYGWDTAILYNPVTWQAEIDRYGDGARLRLFPSYCYEIATNKDNGDKLYGKTASGKKLRKMAEQARTLLERHHAESERLARLDAAHRSGDPGEAVLSRIAEKTGEKKYNLWFGQEAQCSVNVADKELVFTVDNDFTINSIRRHCLREIGETMLELGYVNEEGKLWKCQMIAQPPTVSREQETALAMSSADAINAEARDCPKKQPRRPMTIGQLGKMIAQNK